jgi:hypothetical protein
MHQKKKIAMEIAARIFLDNYGLSSRIFLDNYGLFSRILLGKTCCVAFLKVI